MLRPRNAYAISLARDGAGNNLSLGFAKPFGANEARVFPPVFLFLTAHGSGAAMPCSGVSNLVTRRPADEWRSLPLCDGNL